MVNFKGKLRGDTPPNRVWTAGSVEPDGMWHSNMVTIIHLAAANRRVRPSTVAPKGYTR